jgi:hypothetical protein
MYYNLPEGYQNYQQPTMQSRPQRAGRALPRRRQQQVSDAYYYEDNYPANYLPDNGYAYETYQDYDPYYAQPQPDYGYEVEEWEKPSYPKAKGNNRRARSRDLTIDVDYRTLGE